MTDAARGQFFGVILLLYLIEASAALVVLVLRLRQIDGPEQRSADTAPRTD